MDIKIVDESLSCIKKYVNEKIDIGVILGSGLGDLADKIQNKIIVKYEDIPNIPKSTVKGHKGQFVIGDFMGKKVIMMQGRFHYYEGYSMDRITLPVYIMKGLGVSSLIVTNAAGGVNTSFNPGDLMIIKDSINMSFDNPLFGKNDEKIGPRFPDMLGAYSKKLIDIALKASHKLNIKLQQGIYYITTGPCYETPAEIKMIRFLGGDAVGMSTVPEVIAARYLNLEVLGISCITNMAAGILPKPLNHKEVIETSNKVKDKFTSLIENIIALI
ncbi:MAG: purine-nucleoside phosphorylase [Clostridiaceae bacterium]